MLFRKCAEATNCRKSHLGQIVGSKRNINGCAVDSDERGNGFDLLAELDSTGFEQFRFGEDVPCLIEELRRRELVGGGHDIAEQNFGPPLCAGAQPTFLRELEISIQLRYRFVVFQCTLPLFVTLCAYCSQSERFQLGQLGLFGYLLESTNGDRIGWAEFQCACERLFCRFKPTRIQSAESIGQMQ